MTAHVEDGRHLMLNRRLEDIGWGLFLVMIGILWIVPDATVPQGTWMIGAGLIMIGINVVRYVNDIAVNVFSLLLGVLALAAGVASMSGLNVPVFPLVLIAIGAVLFLKPLLTKTA